MKLCNQIFRSSLQKAISQAGPRYTPGFSDYKDFPSIPIDNLIKAIDGLERNDSFWMQFSSLESSLSSRLNSNRRLFLSGLPDNISRLDLGPCKAACEKLNEHLKRIVGLGRPPFIPIEYGKATRAAKKCHEVFDDIESALIGRLHTLRRSEKIEKESTILEDLYSNLRQFLALISEIEELLRSQQIAISNNPKGLLLGEGNTGKTHFLCDIAKFRVSAKKPTVIVMAKNMISHEDLWQSLLLTLGLRCKKKTFFRFLQNRALARKTRALVIIDGINEADRELWWRGLRSFLEDVEPYNEIAVLISCRSPFQLRFIKKRLFNRFVFLNHLGFSGVEFNAQREFFQWYRLDLPEVPLFVEEFSNPLFLKLFCEAMAKATVQKRHRKIKEISSGQKGMTYIFEWFIKDRQEEIRRNISDKYKKEPFKISNWLWNRGRVEGLVKHIANIMANGKTDHVYEIDFSTTLNSYLADRRLRKEVSNLILSSGIFFEDLIWEGKSLRTVIRFSYQKFSDHLVARAILQKTDCKDGRNIRAMLKSWRDKDHVIEALMVDFPLRSNGRELLDYFDKNQISRITYESFINGLIWRDKDAFDKRRQGNSTIKWMNMCLNYQGLSDDLFDVLFSLSLKRDHPFGSIQLDNYLLGFPLPGRDLIWTEFIRKRWASGAINYALTWIESIKADKIKKANIDNYLRTSRWLLTSTSKYLRDRATKAIYKLGLLHPSSLIEMTIDSLRINDPYVPERLLAASYGVVMTLQGSKSGGDYFINKILPYYARLLYKNMFAPRARYGTTHVLMRDYARFTIEIALPYNPRLLSQSEVARIRPPFKRGGIRKWGRSKDLTKIQTDKGGGPLGMDFENYTIGRLVEERDNYDFQHKDYKMVKAYIYWRIYQLGYNASRFADVDREIANESFYSRNEGYRIERYGKKYSRIAFFELYGFRQDKGLISNHKYGYYNRTSDCDIDPSFPEKPNEYQYLNWNLLGHFTQADQDWVEKIRFPPSRELLRIDDIGDQHGPWLVLYGYAKQEKKSERKRGRLYVHALLIKEEELGEFLKAIKVGCVRLFDLQSIPAGYYTYAGEIPWCETFPNNEPHNIWITGYPKYKEGSGFKVFIPTFEYAWESYHSSFNDISHTIVPARQICEDHGISSKLPGWELLNQNDEVSAKFLRLENKNHKNELCVIKRNLLDAYLNNNRLSLIWIMFLERQILPPDGNIISNEMKNSKSFDVKAKVYHYQDGTVKEKFIRKTSNYLN